MMWDPMPVGIPSLRYSVPADGQLWVGKLRVKLSLKDGHIPWFLWKNGMDAYMEGTDCSTPVEYCDSYHYMTLTSVDYATLSEDYDIEEDPEEYGRYFYVFKQAEGLFTDYIEKYIKIKNESPKGSPERTEAKLLLNACYGRFALNWTMGEETVLQWDPEANDLRFVSYDVDGEEADAYLPVGMFVTSYARARLLHLVRKCCEHYGPGSVIHSDTDSVIHTGARIIDPELEYDKGLGTWATESNPIRIYEGGPKRYIEQLKEKVTSENDYAMACAGVPQKQKRIWRDGHVVDKVPVGMWVELLDDPPLICTHAVLGHEDYSIKSPWLRKRYTDNGLDPDRVDTRKLLPSKVPGGVILTPHQHRLSDNMIMRLRR